MPFTYNGISINNSVIMGKEENIYINESLIGIS